MKYNKKGEKVTALNIEITEKEVDIIEKGKELKLSKTNCIKYALRAWEELGFKKYN